jgi:glycerophosphoryl diester phosphodiesterase
MSDWFVGDFSLKEIKTLKARQAFPGRSKDYDDKFSIPTFEDVLRLVHEKSKQKGRPIGVYPETKKPAYYRKRGHDFAPVLLNALKGFNLDRAVDQVVIQSFDPRILMRLSKMTELPLILLLKENFKWPILMPLIARFTTGIGPDKGLLVRDGKSTGLLERAHKAGLQVHPYTFRNDAVGEGFKDIEEELAFYFELGVDALFTDFTDTAVTVRQTLS